MASILPIATSRVSELLVSTRLTSQVQSDQLALLRLQEQISTGQKLATPSDDAPAALRAMGLQRLLERKSQVMVNLETNLTFLGASDSALSEVSNLLSSARGEALSVVGTTASETQRFAVAESIDRSIQQLVDVGNQKFRGRYLFSGSSVQRQPFEFLNGAVRYSGNEGELFSYSDIDLLFATNVTGQSVFGAISEPVRGSVDLNPVLTPQTRLSSLRGGEGISDGSISVSDGANTSIIDISSAETIGDVARLIEQNPPDGRTVTVNVTAAGLEVQLAGGGLLTFEEVAGGTTTSELGLLEEVGANPVAGEDLNPRLSLTSPLDSILGTRAKAYITPAGDDNDIVLTAKTRGAALNGIDVTFVDGATAGNESAVYDANAGTLVVTIEDGVSTAEQIISAINADGTLPFTADLGPHDYENSGAGPVTTAAAATSAGGSGQEFDQASGLRITNGSQEFNISIASAETVEDLLNILNGSAAGVLAEINSAGTGIDVRSRLSGSDFAIGENGGTTATQLGLRTFTGETRLSELNFGRGVRTADGADLVITRTDGLELDIDLSNAVTVQDVIDTINTASAGVPGVQVTARLAAFGNGIELVSTDPTPAVPLEIRRTQLSAAGEDLGLIPAGAQVSAPATVVGNVSTLTGEDVHATEVQGAFTALIRLRDALRANDQAEIERSLEVLDDANAQLNFTRAEMGARQESLDILRTRLEAEEIELRRTLSEDIDVDLVAAISELTARQASFQASLQASAAASQLTLLDFL